MNSTLKIAVLAGGIGSERDVSLRSGKCVAQAMEDAGVGVVVSDIAPDRLEILEDESIDVFFIALHGEFGEDGQLQQILEDRSLVYTGSGPAASRLAFDKVASKKKFAQAGVAVAKGIEFDSNTDVEHISLLGDKYVIKPIRQGSTIGVTIADEPKEALAAGRKCLDEFGDCMIEEFIAGREITVGVLNGQVLPIIEIKSKSGFYDYQAKYVDEQTEFLFDTIEDASLIKRINTAAMDCFNALGCRHFARVDIILSENGTPYALEVNNIPGFTTRSDLPKAAARIGISMSDMCLRIVGAALNNSASGEEPPVQEQGVDKLGSNPPHGSGG